GGGGGGGGGGGIVNCAGAAGTGRPRSIVSSARALSSAAAQFAHDARCAAIRPSAVSSPPAIASNESRASSQNIFLFCARGPTPAHLSRLAYARRGNSRRRPPNQVYGLRPHIRAPVAARLRSPR